MTPTLDARDGMSVDPMPGCGRAADVRRDAAPDGSDLQVWAIPLSTPSPSILGTLSASEVKQAAQFRNPDDRDRFVVARAALRALIGRCTAQPAARVGITRGSHGAPVAVGTEWRCSVSHAGSWILIGLRWKLPIGVDVEPVRDIADALLVAEHHFHPAEHELLGSLDLVKRSRAFLRIWVRKEAVAKATGLGLSMPLRDWHALYARRVEKHKCPLEVLDSASRRWSVFDVDMDGSCVAAVATAAGMYDLRLRFASLSDLSF